MVDNLSYNYYNTNKSNRLLKITDSGTSGNSVDDYPGTSQDYSYDANGNMTFDGAKNITTEYFPTLNLPQESRFWR